MIEAIIIIALIATAAHFHLSLKDYKIAQEHRYEFHTERIHCLQNEITDLAWEITELKLQQTKSEGEEVQCEKIHRENIR